jgi:threonine synthase
MKLPWTLACSECNATRDAAGLPDVCTCGAPWLVRYPSQPKPKLKDTVARREASMWRYREWLPLADGEEPVTLGEGMTALLRSPTLEKALKLAAVWIKDESQNPTGSFKARGLATAVTRAARAGAKSFTVPTAGNAGVATAAYGRRAGIPVFVWAPKSTPSRLLEQVGVFGGSLTVLDGHIGDCGKAARAYAAEHGAFDMSTLREPYRIEGKKTLGLEVAEQLDWTFPDVLLYPAGGGTGLIGMWKAFNELKDAGWVKSPLPRMFAVQSTGCAPVVKAVEQGADKTEPWPDPVTVASGLRVPAPLGGRLMLRAIRESHGGAVSVTDAQLTEAQERGSRAEALDLAPEGGATIAALEQLVKSGAIKPADRVVLFNTGAGWLYR